MSVYWFRAGRGALVGFLVGLAVSRNNWTMRRRLLAVPVAALLTSTLWWQW